MYRQIVRGALMGLALLMMDTNVMGQKSSPTTFKPTLHPIIAWQIWSTYTMGQEVYDGKSYKSVDDRFNTQIRRSRFGIKGNLLPDISYQLNIALDFIGRDVLSGTFGNSNNGAFPTFGLWNAYLRWKIDDGSDLWHLTLGYTPLNIGRENFTGAMSSISFEKSWSQNTHRRHLTGIGPGRAMGLNMGGQTAEDIVTFSYDIGVFNPLFHALNSNSTGNKTSLLTVGRLAFHFGDPESASYTTSHKVNYFGQRNGITIAVGGAYQGETDLFKKNSAVAIDWLGNWKALSVDGDWLWLHREGTGAESDSHVGYLRLGYSQPLPSGHFLEPTITFTRFEGAIDAEGIEEALTLQTDAGTSQNIDVGVNYYFSPKLKLSLHYTFLEGDQGEARDGLLLNPFFSQGGVGAIKRGDYVGLEIVASL